MNGKKIDRTEMKRVSKAVDDIAQDEKFLETLAESGRDPEARQRFKADPKGHLKKKGKDVSDDVKIEVDDDGHVRISVKGKGASASADFRPREEGAAEAAPGDREDAKRKYAEVVRVMDSAAVLDAVEEAMNDPEVSTRFKADPKAHLAARGISLPAAVTSVKVTEKTNPGYCYEVCYWGWVLFIPYWCCRTECAWWW